MYIEPNNGDEYAREFTTPGFNIPDEVVFKEKISVHKIVVEMEINGEIYRRTLQDF